MTSIAKQGKISHHPGQVTLAKLLFFQLMGLFIGGGFLLWVLFLFFLPVSLSSVLKYHFHLAMINDYLGVIEQSSVLR